MFILKPLTDLRIASLWGAQLLSATGAEFYMVAVIWIASSIIGREAGYISGMQAAALFVGSLFGGIVTERLHRLAHEGAHALDRLVKLLDCAAEFVAAFFRRPHSRRIMQNDGIGRIQRQHALRDIGQSKRFAG